MSVSTTRSLRCSTYVRCVQRESEKRNARVNKSFIARIIIIILLIFLLKPNTIDHGSARRYEMDSSQTRLKISNFSRRTFPWYNGRTRLPNACALPVLTLQLPALVGARPFVQQALDVASQNPVVAQHLFDVEAVELVGVLVLGQGAAHKRRYQRNTAPAETSHFLGKYCRTIIL